MAQVIYTQNSQSRPIQRSKLSAMDLIIDEKHFPLWFTPDTPITDERLMHLREANKLLRIERAPDGKLFVELIQQSSNSDGADKPSENKIEP